MMMLLNPIPFLMRLIPVDLIRVTRPPINYPIISQEPQSAHGRASPEGSIDFSCG